MFFLLQSDSEPILKNAEEVLNVHYFKIGMFESKNIPYYQSIFSVPNFGFAHSGDWNRVDSYLAMPRNSSLEIRDVPQRTGEMRYAVDQSTNKNSIEVKLGGIYSETDRVLVAGRIGTISQSEFSLDAYKRFSSLIKKECRKIGSFYVGKGAEEKLREGWRLVTNDRSPKEYDLSFE